jgi:hypothetical protein
MNQQVHSIINEVFSDLEQAFADVGALMDAEDLADTVCDRMYDESAEYRSMPYEVRRAHVVNICKQYV